MKTYELTCTISARLASEEITTLVKTIEGFIQEKEGVIVTSQKSTAQTLAYPIKKQGSGYFVTIIFQASEDTITPIKAKLELEKDVLRHIILIKKPVREVKERRTRKTTGAKESAPSIASNMKDEKRAEKIDNVDLDKKLDEILGE